MNTYTSKIVAKKQIANNMVELDIVRPEGFEFLSGQFIQIMIPNGDTPAPRAYSICSTPADKNIVLCVKMLKEGVGSNYIREIKEGDEIDLRGPSGHFVLNEDVPLLCVATGAGIAPVISLIRDHLENKKSQKKIHLLFGVRSQEDMFWQDAFESLKNSHPNFSYTLTLSQPKDGWGGTTGRVTAHVGETEDDTHAYLCGSPAMVQEVRKILVEKGIEANKIHFEIF